MPTTFLLIGHCGADSANLRRAIKAAAHDAVILVADDDQELAANLAGKIDLVLLNRELGYGFRHSMGIDMIHDLKVAHPELKTMLVTNYPDIQAAAVKAGALPGFGKRELGRDHVVQLLRNAIARETA